MSNCKCGCGCFLCDPPDEYPDLENTQLDQNTINSLKAARSYAKDVAEHLDPEHITGWPTLITLLKDFVKRAEKEREIYLSLTKIPV